MASEGEKAPLAPEAAAPPEFDMSDPSSSSYGEGARFLRDMLDPASRITDAGARVLHLADRTMAGLPEGGKVFLARSRELFVRAMATIDSHDMPVEVRRAVNTAIWEAFKIAEIKGGLDTVLFERRFGPSERASPMYKDKKNKAEARRKLELEIIDDKPWSLSKKGGRLAEQLLEAVQKHTGEPVSLATIKRDLAILKKRAKVSQGL